MRPDERGIHREVHGVAARVDFVAWWIELLVAVRVRGEDPLAVGESEAFGQAAEHLIDRKNCVGACAGGRRRALHVENPDEFLGLRERCRNRRMRADRSGELGIRDLTVARVVKHGIDRDRAGDDGAARVVAAARVERPAVDTIFIEVGPDQLTRVDDPIFVEIGPVKLGGLIRVDQAVTVDVAVGVAVRFAPEREHRVARQQRHHHVRRQHIACIEQIEQRLLLVDIERIGEIDDREERDAVDARGRLVHLDQDVVRVDGDVLDAHQRDLVRARLQGEVLREIERIHRPHHRQAEVEVVDHEADGVFVQLAGLAWVGDAVAVLVAVSNATNRD